MLPMHSICAMKRDESAIACKIGSRGSNYKVILMQSALINDLNEIVIINLRDLGNKDNGLSLIDEFNQRE